MRAGLLDKRITIQQKTVTQDSAGIIAETWATFAVVWASVEPLTGRERFMAQQIFTDMDIRIRIRYLSGVTPMMRVSFNNKLYNIHAVINPRERNVELELLCAESGTENA